MERIEGLHAEGRALDAAYRTAYAFADGDALVRERERWLSSLALAPGETEGTLSEADEATILYILSRHPKPQMVS